jgi:hypothetical protein
MQLAVIDLEASGFGRGSYPIEVGLALPDGSLQCMLIRPEQDWQHWDAEAEALHGIDRETLLKFGTDIKDVATLLNDWLSETTVYSDAWGNDSSWLGLLFETAGIVQRFKIESLRTVMSEVQVENWHCVKDKIVQELSFQRHRASNDARILQMTYSRTLALSQKSA